ncbi:SDR family NAD(P)-dependent oxidoreductase [Congregibacter litoralis]|uniref:Probable oxidoreductase n=1 Tax=Congregibacter litoralis KT71 TaxID=314285 RepID=A4A7C2_9GAMM|nr:SDR family NAD(P)-dependent oxidoreductase [Congregibacter litoralis]EAQ98191.1 Dehydrogenase with unknown specificity [Congregibacter litoralis KT71]
MTTAQTPIASGFDGNNTALEVIDGIDLSGKQAVVTGGYSGLGLETTRALATAGAKVLVPARRPEHAKAELAAFADLPGEIEIDILDLGDLESVQDFANRFLERGRSIDMLINNAAIMACPETRLAQNREAQFATNHLGHFALTMRLYPALKASGGARVVSLSSTGHKLSPIRWDDLMFDEDEYNKWIAYGQAKTANSLFAVELDALGKSDDVRAFAVHPGGIMTPLQRHLPREEMIAMGWIDEEGTVNAIFKNPEQGAATSVWAATAPALDAHGGVYCEDCNIAAETVKGSDKARFSGVDAHAIDSGEAKKLWSLSELLTGTSLE